MDTVKEFAFTEVRQAIKHAQEGGIALHNAGYHRVPGQASEVRVAHLFDQDEERLRRLANKLGVKRVIVQDSGTPRQHIDLWGEPLSDALLTLENHMYCRGGEDV